MKRPWVAMLLVLAIVAAACTSDGDGSSDPDGPQVAGICAESTPDCDDTVVIGESPLNAGPDGSTPGAGILVGGGLTVPEALATNATGIIAVQGFYFDDGTGLRLCESLAESFPPQCGGAQIPLADSGLAFDDLQTQGAVTWSNAHVVVLGELVDGTLHPAESSI